MMEEEVVQDLGRTTMAIIFLTVSLSFCPRHLLAVTLLFLKIIQILVDDRGRFKLKPKGNASPPDRKSVV